MPERGTKRRAQRAKREGKAPSTQAGQFVREEIEHVRRGKHGARSTKQAIAIGLSKARRAGVKLASRQGQALGEDAKEGGPRLYSRPDPQKQGDFAKTFPRGFPCAPTRGAPSGFQTIAVAPGTAAATTSGIDGRLAHENFGVKKMKQETTSPVTSCQFVTLTSELC
jgi:hypothetical protein